jgi:uncharacterized protein YqeY
MGLVEEMNAALRGAMKARDRVAVSALRAALAAVANAGAAPIDSAPSEVRGRLVEHERVSLTDAETTAIVRAQIDDRRQIIAQLDGRGQDVEVARLAGEIAVLDAVLGGRDL